MMTAGQVMKPAGRGFLVSGEPIAHLCTPDGKKPINSAFRRLCNRR